jgi:hypothetical protein
MKNLLSLLVSVFFIANAYAQSPGLIIRPLPVPGITALNPDGNGYSSTGTTGFTSDDITQSEVPYKIVPAAISEPTGDLNTGPTGGFTDIVTRVDGSGFYLYKDASNIYFRLRVGNVISGSKSYSILLDTDGKMGSSGSSTDPNYVAPSGSSNGNPGFEYEVSFQTNNQVAVYAIDGVSTPPAPTTFSLNSNSQISVALSTDGNNPDYFYDWYVPLTAIGSPSILRMVATTLTSPGSALTGTRSDVYGVNDGNYAITAEAWMTVINAQPIISLSPFVSVGSTCTAAPVLNSPITAGSNISVTGTWTRMDASKPSTATIKLYRNNNPSPVGTTTVTTGNTWSITVATVSTGDLFYAKAVATGESECLQSNNVISAGCSTPLAMPVLTCASTKGISGTITSGTTVSVYYVPSSSSSPTSNLVSTGANLTYPTATSFAFMSNGCTGSPVLSAGSYMVVASNGSCTSAPRFECITSGSSSILGLSANTLSLTTPIYPYNTSISGTGSALNDILRLYINGQYNSTITATGASFTFTGLSLNSNDQLQVYSQKGTSCMTVSPIFTVSCYTTPPVITVNTTGNLVAGATTVKGSSSYPGAFVQLYKGTAPSGTTVGSPATVNSFGSWSVTTPALIDGETYYCTQTTGGCISVASSQATVLGPTACPGISFAAAYSDISSSVTVNMSAFTGTLRLYEDGALIATSTALAGATSYTFTGLANTLYYNGVLTVTAKTATAAESVSCASQAVACTPVLTPVITPTTATINAGQTVSFSVSNVTANAWYALMDYSGNSFGTSQYITTTTPFTLTTKTINTASTYNLKLTADKLTGCPASFATASITVNPVTLPVSFLSVNVQSNGNGALLTWTVANELDVLRYEVEKSTDCRNFSVKGQLNYKQSTGTTNTYSFTDNTVNGQDVCYRIKQIDLNGNMHYSRIVNLSGVLHSNTVAGPNPASHFITISKSSTASEKISVSLVDMQGRMVYQRYVVLLPGMNSFDISNLEVFGKGQYVVQLLGSRTREYVKVVVQ